jgi:pimeloyl-ACP methyl ester carboxylesterase
MMSVSGYLIGSQAGNKAPLPPKAELAWAPHPEPSAYAKKFYGKYEHRTIAGGIGHNLPQEAPQAFAQAIIDVDKA